MKTTRWLICGGSMLAAGWILAAAPAMAESMNYSSQIKGQESKYHSPEDLISMVPILGKIPRAFSMGDGYSMKISPQQVRFDHRSRLSRSKGAPKACTLGLSYTAPVGGSFSSRIDLPIFNGSTLVMSDWSRTSLSDYAVFMSHTPADHAGLKIALSARF